MTPGAAVRAVGMVSAVGTSALQTATSVRAGIARFRETSICDRHFEPLRMALLPDDHLPPLAPTLDARGDLTTRQARMLRLASAALAEAVGGAGDADDLPLFLALPEALPGRAEPAGARFLDDLRAQTGGGFDPLSSATFPHGRAAGFAALQAALRRLGTGMARAVVVGGVDSYLDLYLLGVMDHEARLLTRANSDGFIPGEGAAFVVLTRDGAGSLAWLDAVGVGSEAGHRYSDAPCLGDGLTDALRDALAGGHDAVRTVLAGFTGESFGAREWGPAYRRHHARFAPDAALAHPADGFGDTGAALGPMLVALAAVGLARGTLDGPCLAWTASDRAPRGAARLRRAT